MLLNNGGMDLKVKMTEEEILKMTIPDKPDSRKQRYYSGNNGANTQKN